MNAAPPEAALRPVPSLLRAAAIWRKLSSPWPCLIVLSAIGLLLSAGASRTILPPQCGGDWEEMLSAARLSDRLALVLALNPPSGLLGSWAVMLLTMTPPLLAAPLRQLWRADLPTPRMGALLGFVLGYGAIWMAAGPALIGLGMMMQVLGGSLALAAALAFALAWSASPWRRAIDRDHCPPSLDRFGSPILNSSLGFGYGVRCCGSCWAWMLTVQVAGAWHTIAMILVTVAIATKQSLASGELRLNRPLHI